MVLAVVLSYLAWIGTQILIQPTFSVGIPDFAQTASLIIPDFLPAPTRSQTRGENMDGRPSGVGYPILLGGYLLYKYLPQTKLFNENADSLDGPMAAFGAFLLIFGLAFLYKNLK